MNNQLLINIGNTHVQVADVVAGRLRLMARYDTSSILHAGFIPSLDNAPDCQAIALCVVPKLKDILLKKYEGRITFLTKDNFPQLNFTKVDASTLGMDRISNAAFAFANAHSAVTVIDFGTCINSVCVDSEGHFLGGAICPGRMLLRQALAEHTAQLPLIPIDNDNPKAIGTTTREAIFAGVDGGVLGSVRHLMAATQQELAAPCSFWATGGDADYFLKWIPELIPAPDLMTLRGILCATIVP